MPEPIGSLCVLRDDDLAGWVVAICRGRDNPKEILRRFATRGEASEFALAERDRRKTAGTSSAVIHFPDDCPCTGGTGGEF
jgi:hypothetical protein